MNLIKRLRSDLILWGFLNLLVVALLGVLMRYKIAFEFPFFNQKHLQHAHSHFAFYGWMSHMLMVLLVQYFRSLLDTSTQIKIKYFIVVGLILSFGMLVSFVIQGYGLISILISTLAFLNTVILVVYFTKSLLAFVHTIYSIKWILLAFFCNIISSLGTFYLGYIFGSGKFDQNTYLASIYFFLHFQYNGWFLFACLGLLFRWIELQGIKLELPAYVFYTLGIASIPAYLLSILWWNLPTYLYACAITAALAQLIGYWGFIKGIRNLISLAFKDPKIRYAFVLVALALVFKYLLQFASLFPEISKWAFGIRPVVIAYLHLNFLNILSLSIVLFVIAANYSSLNRMVYRALWVFILAISVNELVLGAQGVFSVFYIGIPRVNVYLFIIAVSLLFSAFALLIMHIKLTNKTDINHP